MRKCNNISRTHQWKFEENWTIDAKVMNFLNFCVGTAGWGDYYSLWVICVQQYKENVKENSTYFHFFRIIKELLTYLFLKAGGIILPITFIGNESGECVLFFKRWNFVKFSLYFPYIVVRMWHLSYSYTAVVFSSSGYCTKTSKIHNFWTDCLIFLKLSMMCSTNIATFSQSLCLWRWTCPLILCMVLFIERVELEK